jgi:hypothetical protein
MDLLINILGWAGSASLLLGYGLNSYQKIKSNSLAFLGLNIFGGISLIVYTAFYQAYANTALNVVWVIIAIPALFKIIRNQKETA